MTGPISRDTLRSDAFDWRSLFEAALEQQRQRQRQADLRDVVRLPRGEFYRAGLHYTPGFVDGDWVLTYRPANGVLVVDDIDYTSHGYAAGPMLTIRTESDYIDINDTAMVVEFGDPPADAELDEWVRDGDRGGLPWGD